MKKNNQLKISVVCIGSRENYGLPVALNRLGMLHTLYTDIYMPRWMTVGKKITQLPSGFRSLLGRNHADLPYNKVKTLGLLGWDIRLKLRKASSLYEGEEILCDCVPRMADCILNYNSLGNIQQFIGFTGESLELYRVCKEKGVRIIHNQVDAGLYERELIKKIEESNPGWSIGNVDEIWSQRFECRVKSELDLADDIIVNSTYSMKALNYWGITKNIHVLPIASSVPRSPRTQVNKHDTLRVLFLGILSLRKGIHVALPAIDNLVRKGVKVELILAGKTAINLERLKPFKGVQYIGAVPGSDVPALMDSCDVFLFPTFSDGFGMVQVEAISRGLPVIATENCAAVIKDGVSGFIVPIDSVKEVENRLEAYCNDRDLLWEHSCNAYERSAHFTEENYLNQVKEMFNDG